MTATRREFLGTAAALALLGTAPLRAADKQPAAQQSIKTGGVRTIEVDGKYKVWTKKVGAGKIKLLTLHGGPGCTHEYFECFEDFLPAAGVEFGYTINSEASRFQRSFAGLQDHRRGTLRRPWSKAWCREEQEL